MLATSSIGAVWSSCSPDFGINGVRDRFGQIEPKVLFTADGYRYAGKPHTGGLVIYGRSDAVLNPGGVRIGTAEIYRQVESFDEIIESLVIGQQWDSDVRVVLFVRLRDEHKLTDDLRARIKLHVREQTTPRHVPAKIVQVSDIPRTRSGKIVELAVRKVVHGERIDNVEALANPEALTLFENLEELQS